jgi:hypothetical protein
MFTKDFDGARFRDSDEMCLFVAMRRFILVTALLLAGCATRPQPTPPIGQPQPVPVQPQTRGDLLGLTAGELFQRFGQPALQVREGPGLKLQFRGAACVLDAYLYPPPQGRGPERVTHVDARSSSGADADQRTCIAALQGA